MAPPIATSAVACPPRSLTARATLIPPPPGSICGSRIRVAHVTRGCREALHLVVTGAASGGMIIGFAFAKEYGIERKWRECRLYQIAPISTNMILAYIGQHVLGMPRSY